MDEGAPIAYEVLDEGVPVYASGGEQIGTVDHVVAAPEADIFHGIVVRAGGERRFVAADQVASLHERGADLNITAAEAASLPVPEGAAAAWRVAEPGVRPSHWGALLQRLAPRSPRRGGWTKQR